MSKLKLLTVILTTALLAAFVFPVFALTYNPGVVSGQYVKYGNFVGVGQGVESFNDYDWLRATSDRCFWKISHFAFNEPI